MWSEEGRNFTFFDGCFIFTATPEKSFKYLKSLYNILNTDDVQMKEKTEFLCVRLSNIHLGHYCNDMILGKGYLMAFRHKESLPRINSHVASR